MVSFYDETVANQKRSKMFDGEENREQFSIEHGITLLGGVEFVRKEL